MNVFVTVGLERKPFSRLLKAVDEAVSRNWLPPDTFVQYGHTPFPSPHCKAARFLSFDQLKDAIQKADLVISHGGVGSVLLALEAGIIPLVVPRQSGLGEHVDNHQTEFVQKMEERGRVLAAYTIREFNRILESREWKHTIIKLKPHQPEIIGRLRAILQNREGDSH
ncbi:MAG: hypothetical protein GXO69_07125 [Acidobacteria bacterium]|nr:hypothetical protein [Acidobacteriota bacterium]